MSINNQIRSGNSWAFRDIEIKRRQLSDGKFESEWQSITDDVSKWFAITRKADVTRLSRFKFNNIALKMSNLDGKYSPSTNDNSLWNGFASEQRTLVRVRSGFDVFTTLASGQVVRTQLPGGAPVYGSGIYGTDVYGINADQFMYRGIISGDIVLNADDTATLPVKPLTQVFIDFPARSIEGWTSTGLSAEEFMLKVRDQTDGSGNYIFLPFFGDTTTGFNIQSTTNNYATLNTSTADDVRDKTVWDIMTKLAEAENFVIYTDKDGTLNFVDVNQSTAPSYEIYGLGNPNNEFGNTVKKINSVSKKITDYYSRVQVEHAGLSEIHTLSITSGADGAEEYDVEVDGNSVSFTTTASQTALQVANAISAQAFAGWRLSQSGTTITFTADGQGARTGAYQLDPATTTASVAGTFTRNVAGTSSSIFIKEATFTVNGSNTAWNFGHRTFNLSNTWLATQTANDIADALFNELSAVRTKVDVTCSFIPQLDVKDKILLSYDPTPYSLDSLWDRNDWDTELTWDGASVKGEPYSFNRKEFKIESLTQDLDKMETKLLLRES